MIQSIQKLRLLMATGLAISMVTPLSAKEVTLAETLPPLKEGKAPQNHAELWADFDPRAEALDTEILHEWEEDGVVMKVLRYRVGVFKGKKAMIAAVYGYPKAALEAGQKLPGLVQIHGGGQYADHKAVLTNAKRGYVTLSISWAGRISSPQYRVSPAEVKLFWEGKTDDKAYRLTTDWGALDGYHAPSRNDKYHGFGDDFVAKEWTIDAVPSARNSSWFLAAMGARRGLTFLEQQAVVDGDKLGVYGHSMGGKLTVMTAGSDARVKAAAPSCGGMTDRYSKNAVHKETIGDAAGLKNIKCPTIFLSPANDFHGTINDLIPSTEELGDNEWRVTCSAHINHKDRPENEVASQLWFDQYLKGTFQMAKTPKTQLTLKTDSGTPQFKVTPDTSQQVLEVDVYYCQQGVEAGATEDIKNRINRFWHHAKAVKQGGVWVAELPLAADDKPLWVYANVVYPLANPVTGAGYYYGTYTTDKYNLSSLVKLVNTAELKSAGVKVTLQPSLVIEDFQDAWKKEWFTTNPKAWPVATHKVYSPLWKAPKGAKLAFDVKVSEANQLVLALDSHVAMVDLSGGDQWQAVSLSSADFLNGDKEILKNWEAIKELRLGNLERVRSKEGVMQTLGGAWKGEAPTFRNLRWLEE